MNDQHLHLLGLLGYFLYCTKERFYHFQNITVYKYENNLNKYLIKKIPVPFIIAHFIVFLLVVWTSVYPSDNILEAVLIFPVSLIVCFLVVWAAVQPLNNSKCIFTQEFFIKQCWLAGE